MALWGNNDNVGSAGTVSLNYATATVTGTGTSFGIAGGCSEGDVIRFGSRGSGGTFFGDAVIVSIANSESLTIGSTMGLTGAAIAGAQFTVSQLPKSSVLNIAFSRTKAENCRYSDNPTSWICNNKRWCRNRYRRDCSINLHQCE